MTAEGLHGTRVVDPPPDPGHAVRLFNWSRVTRRVVRALWYAAFPFTLVNVARQMRPEGVAARRIHFGLVELASVAMTLLTAIWVMAAAESVPLLFQVGKVGGLEATQLAMWVAATVLMLIAFLRSREAKGAGQTPPPRDETGARRHGLAHAALIAACALVAELLEPAQQVLSPDSFFLAHASHGPTQQGLEHLNVYLEGRPSSTDTYALETYPYLDIVGLASYVLLAIVLVAALVAALMAFGNRDEGMHDQPPHARQIDPGTHNSGHGGRHPRRKLGGPLAGTALCLALAGLLALLTLTALFRSLPALVARLARWLPNGPGFDYPPRTRLLPQFGASAADAALPLVSLVLLASLVVILLLRSRFRLRFAIRPAVQWLRLRVGRRGALSIERSQLAENRKAMMEWSHKVISERLTPVIADSVLLLLIPALVTEALLVRYLVGRAQRDEDRWIIEFVGSTAVTGPIPRTFGDWAIATGAGVAVAVGFWIISKGSGGPLSGVLASVGDIAGFWPITVSPFGGRPYRDEVIEDLRALVEACGREQVVLVGHSQGSVLAAWLIYEDASSEAPDGDQKYAGLVTCGSPLKSLYSRFFPATFSEEFFTDIGRGSHQWVNVWRHTDPIATDLPAPCENLEPLHDPSPSDDPHQINGHSNYWTEFSQQTAVTDLMRQP